MREPCHASDARAAGGTPVSHSRRHGGRATRR